MSSKILVVDDEVDILHALRDILEFEDYEITMAFNGKEALARIGDERPDLVITDIMMPMMDGLSLIKCIRDNLKDSSLPIILMSAGASHENELNPGWNKFLKKPLDIDRILNSIDELLPAKR